MKRLGKTVVVWTPPSMGLALRGIGGVWTDWFAGLLFRTGRRTSVELVLGLEMT